MNPHKSVLPQVNNKVLQVSTGFAQLANAFSELRKIFDKGTVMSVVEVREVKKNIKKHKNAIDNHNYSHSDSMQWGMSHQSLDKALSVGSTHPKAELKRIKKIQKQQAIAAAQQKQMFDIHEAAKRAIEANKVAQ